MGGETLEHVEVDDLNSYSTFFMVLAVTTALCLWAALYRLLVLVNHSKGCEWNFNIVATCFSVLIVLMSFVCMVFFNPPLLQKLCHPSNTAAVVTMCVSLGYFCYDTIWCILHWEEKKDSMNLIHHVVTIILHCLILFSGVCADLGTNVIFGTEISTPLLLARWFMREKQMNDRLIYHLNDFAFVGLFFLFRIFIGSWYIWTVVLDPGCPFLSAKLFLIVIYFVSLGFAVSLLRMVYFKVKKLRKLQHDDDRKQVTIEDAIKRTQASTDESMKPEIDLNLNEMEQQRH